MVDNASADGTAAFVRERFPRCRVIEPGENLGFGRACNLAARESASEHILLLNPDAWVDAPCVERLRGAMAGDASAGLGGAASLLPRRPAAVQLGADDRDLRRSGAALRNRFESRAWVHDALPRVVRGWADPGWYTAACGLVRRRAWDEVDGFDPGFFLYFEDADLGLRLRACRLASGAGRRRPRVPRPAHAGSDVGESGAFSREPAPLLPQASAALGEQARGGKQTRRPVRCRGDASGALGGCERAHAQRLDERCGDRLDALADRPVEALDAVRAKAARTRAPAVSRSSYAAYEQRSPASTTMRAAGRLDRQTLHIARASSPTPASPSSPPARTATGGTPRARTG